MNILNCIWEHSLNWELRFNFNFELIWLAPTLKNEIKVDIYSNAHGKYYPLNLISYFYYVKKIFSL